MAIVVRKTSTKLQTSGTAIDTLDENGMDQLLDFLDSCIYRFLYEKSHNQLQYLSLEQVSEAGKTDWVFLSWKQQKSSSDNLTQEGCQ
ncbi:uncharacterized protein EAF01_010761 [Botrytis porri]|uniref:uncharacterized protein n=1 Tax=Botrytis porri TaxID=87229 RepID=UPI0019009277|nr:uncharacterized protein EAF01_010761 [Botrytis porri]KAF7889268.1 hypothetical protein EAF01_010761 [Botrytis porri]